MEVKDFLIVKRNVKYPRIELKGKFVLILPLKGNFRPEEIIEKHRVWIEKKIEFIEKIKGKYKDKKIYKRDDEELKRIVLKYIKRYSEKMKVKVKKIYFRDMNSKWASCRRNGSLSFNLKLKYLPKSLIKYVVFHEMVHILIPNHKSIFWDYIKKEFKNPEKYEEMLYGYWFSLFG
ncbi:MAG TPA: M48 family metallopeptidase [bacterium]|nr:M48 family metallopeptidase [bacterium]HOM27728.1 M48 family metallopeptidase [bacterium]